jgi:hypothetical protein
MALRDRIKAALPGIADSEVDGLIDWKENQSLTAKLKRNIHLQRASARLLQANPGIFPAIGKPGDTPFDTVSRGLQMVADPAGAKKIALALHGTGRESHDEILAYVAQGVGAENISDLKRNYIAVPEMAEMTDQVVVRRDVGTIQDRISSGKPADRLELDPRGEERAADAHQRRALLGNLWDDAARATPPKVRMADPGDDRRVDLERAWSAVHDTPLQIDPESRGAQMWAERFKPETVLGNMALERKVAESEEVAGRVRAGRAYEQAVEDSTMNTPEGATAVAYGGDDLRPDAEAIERRFRED